MPSLETAGTRFETQFIVLGGGGFSGVITAPSTREPSAFTFNQPRRILTTRVEASAEAGQVVVSAFGQEYLLGLNGIDEVGYPAFKSFRIFEVTDQMTWKVQKMLQDPVTGLDRGMGWEEKGVLHVVREPVQTYPDREFHMTDSKYRVITGEDIVMGDKLDDFTVRKVDHVLGVNLLEIS